MKKFFYLSLGCKVNSYESNALKEEFTKEGYIYSEIDPDVIFINTCSVTATADQKSRQHIRKLMNKYPNAISVVMGCYSQGHHKFIFDEIKPNIVVGTSNRSQIPSLIKKFELDHKNIDLTEDKPRFFSYEELGINKYSEMARAYLKIEDGCDNFCSYCLIPYIRGKMRSRPYNEILDEAKALVSHGYKEIVLTGIHIGGYGKDLEGNINFSSLVRDLLDIPNLYRLRISSLEASEIDEELIHLINTRSNLAKHFHIPLQSGSDTVLKRMNRKYDCETFYNTLSMIRKACPNVAFTTDVIVGFPGESEEEFLETYNFIKKCEFNMLHVFPFSSREGTLASKMPNHINPAIKKERTLRLIELSNELWNKYTDQFVNQEVEVLVEQYSKDKKVSIGHTTNYLEVAIPEEYPEGSIVKTVYKK